MKVVILLQKKVAEEWQVVVCFLGKLHAIEFNAKALTEHKGISLYKIVVIILYQVRSGVRKHMRCYFYFCNKSYQTQ